MDIKDYLHLYIGCQCIADGNEFTLKGVQYNDSGTLAYDGFTIEGIPQGWWVENCDFKIVLRSLKSLTNKEAKEVGKLLEEGFTATSPMVHKYHFTPKAFLWYLSKHFDLFSLIENNLAIDAKTLKP